MSTGVKSIIVSGLNPFFIRSAVEMDAISQGAVNGVRLFVLIPSSSGLRLKYNDAKLNNLEVLS